MKKLLMPLLACVLLVACMGVAARQTSRLTAMENTLKEVYLSALNESREDLRALSLHMEKLLLTSDASQAALHLHAVSSAAQDVRRSLTLLPFSHQAMASTIAFANQLADYTSTLLPQLVQQGGLPASARTQLTDQLSACSRLVGQLALAAPDLTPQRLSAVALERAFSLDPAPQSRPLEILSDGDHGMDYPALTYDGPFSSAARNIPPKALPQGEITQEEALSIARQFVGPDRVVSVRSAPGTTGLIPAYGVSVQTHDLLLNLEVTRQGGQVLWMMPETASFSATQSIDACRSAAVQFLQSRGFPTMADTAFQLYDGLCVFSFVPLQGEILLYPDVVKVQLRMDTAQVVGFEAHSYWTNHIPRTLPSPALTAQQARQKLAPYAAAESPRLCLVPHNAKEVLCYEVTLTHAGNTYLVYLDAATGREVNILKLISTPSGTLAA